VRCRKCQNDGDRKLYGSSSDRRARVRERVNQQRALLRDTVDQIKRVSPCFVCGESCLVCLDFHHRDPNLKDLDIAHIVHNAWKLDRLLREIKKCVVLCACCHRKVHAGLIVV
jgi:hypothetical protein